MTVFIDVVQEPRVPITPVPSPTRPRRRSPSVPAGWRERLRQQRGTVLDRRWTENL